MEEMPAALTPEKTSQKGLWIIALVAALVVTGGSVALLLWQQEKAARDDLNKKVAALNAQLDAAKKTDTSKPEMPGEETTYTAEVGKFTLTLPNTYSIIKEIDGGFEGGPITKLQIGTNIDDGTNVVATPPTSSFELIAINGSSHGGSFESWVSTQNKAESSETPEVLPDKSIDDGTPMKFYFMQGLFDQYKIYFNKNDVWYAITTSASSKNPDDSAILTDFIKGFKFNS